MFGHAHVRIGFRVTRAGNESDSPTHSQLKKYDQDCKSGAVVGIPPGYLLIVGFVRMKSDSPTRPS